MHLTRNHLASLTTIVVCTFVTFACHERAVLAQQPQKKLLVHYMAWYASKPVSGTWGWHWTMNQFNPETKNKDGLRQIASHDYPLVGPYDSNDDDLLEYHVLLMKMAGIDGVVIDWYGREPFRDYAKIHRNSLHLINWLEKANLQFMVCYEDQSLGHLAKAKKLTVRESVSKAEAEIDWLSENWFPQHSYVKLENRPALMVFGPQYLTREQWKNILKQQDPQPEIFGLPHLALNHGFQNAFAWPPVSGGKIVSEKEWQKHLNAIENNRDLKLSVPVVFPRFKDIYKQAKIHESYGTIEDRGGKTFVDTLSMAIKSKSELVQIATWNDHGEGTSIEPTVNHGYLYLEKIQEQFGGRYSNADLRLAKEIYDMRKSLEKGAESDSILASQLDTVVSKIIQGKTNEARAILKAHADRLSRE